MNFLGVEEVGYSEIPYFHKQCGGSDIFISNMHFSVRLCNRLIIYGHIVRFRCLVTGSTPLKISRPTLSCKFLAFPNQKCTGTF